MNQYDKIIIGLLVTLLIIIYLVFEKKERFTNRAEMLKQYLSKLNKFPSYKEYKRNIKDGDMVEWAELKDLGLSANLNSLSKFIL